MSTWLGRDVYVKRDDLTPLAMGGKSCANSNTSPPMHWHKAPMRITAGALQSNHVRQTAAIAAKLGLGCIALLENPLGTEDANYIGNGNRLLLDLFDAKVELVESLDNADEQLQALPSACAITASRTWCRWWFECLGSAGVCTRRARTGRAGQGHRPEVCRRSSHRAAPAPAVWRWD